MAKLTPFSVRLSEADRSYLDRIAIRENTSVAGAIAALIKEHRQGPLRDEELVFARSVIRRILCAVDKPLSILDRPKEKTS